MDVEAALDRLGRHGLAAMQVRPDGDVVHLRGGVTADSSFEWGSITKTVTGTLLAVLSDRGVVRLDTTLGEVLPGAPAIRLDALASHTSGLPRLLPGSLRFVRRTWRRRHDPYAAEGTAEVLAALRETRVRSDGAVRYSNAGAGLLGLALVTATSTSYDDLVQEHVCGPLGLTTVTTKDGAGLVDGHDRRGRVVPHWHFQDALVGCGGLRGSVTDLARWARAVAGDAPEPLRSALALACRPVARGRGSAVGLGWHLSVAGGPTGLRAPQDGQRSIRWHNGGTGGFRSFVASDEASGHGVAVLGASVRSVDGLGLQLLEPRR